MIDLLVVYRCPKCGEILEDQVEMIEDIDTENDDVWTEAICGLCGAGVAHEMVDGQTVFQKVDHERWLWATGYYKL